MRRAIAIVVLLLVGSTVTAQAAWAGVTVGHTNLTIFVRGSSVSGSLVGRPECRPNQTIELWVDGALQSSTTTDGAGGYAFTGSFSFGSTVQTRFGGSQTGVHPDRFVCTPALSRLVVVIGHPSSAAFAPTFQPLPFLGLERFATPLTRGGLLTRVPFLLAL